MPAHAIGRVRRADKDPDDYEHFGVLKDKIEDREDGRREDPLIAGTFEWWYFEVVVPDPAGGKPTGVVAAFLTKPMEGQGGALQPVVSVKVRLPDQDQVLGKEVRPPASTFQASESRCDVRAGKSSCVYEPTQGGGGRYLLTFDEDFVKGTIELQRMLAPARIGTGHLLFERDSSMQYLGWLVPVPAGKATVDLTVDGKRIQGPGGGYHDHNWGDRPMAVPLHHWYWGRAAVGKYVLIAANTVVGRSYGCVHHTDLILVKDGQFIALGHANTSFLQSPPLPDPDTGKPVSDEIVFRFQEGSTRYLATFKRAKTELTRPLGDAAYHRFSGEFTLEIFDGTSTQTLQTRSTTWELMWLGDAASSEALAAYSDALTMPSCV